MFVIKADTASEMRDEVIAWAKEQASGYRRQSAVAQRKKLKNEYEARAATYEYIALFFLTLKVEPK